MDWIKGIDWEKLYNPHPMFKVFKPEDAEDPEDPFFKKVARLKTMIKKEFLWISDEWRSDEAVHAVVMNDFYSGRFNVFYEVGDIQAVIGLMDIIPEFKCGATFKIIDKKVWGPDLARATTELFELYIKEFRLKRISSQTADKRILRMAEMAGFKLEGVCPDAFRWNKKFYPLYIVGKYGGQ